MTGNLRFGGKPDAGIAKALKLRDLPRTGIALELGCGTARNLEAMSEIFPKSQGYELDTDWIATANARFKKHSVNATVHYQDVLHLTHPRDSIAVVAAGVVIYHSKSEVFELFKGVWQWIKPYGILHVEFPTTDDETINTDFFIYTCLPFKEEGFENSYGHYCGFNCNMDHPGVRGTSFWEKDEVLEFMRTLGKHKLIHYQRRNWLQNVGQDEPALKRSFHIVTVQKLD